MSHDSIMAMSLEDLQQHALWLESRLDSVSGMAREQLVMERDEARAYAGRLVLELKRLRHRSRAETSDGEAGDGYPTNADLERIVSWPMEDAAGALEFVRSMWHWPMLAKRDGQDLKVFEFVTGGWSGNESLIGALEENVLLRGLCWWSSERGGKHVWRLP